MNKKYFIYARKSSEDKKKQIQSIDDQISVLSELAKQRGFEVIDVIKDEKSAKSPGRIGFGNMVARLQNGEAQGVLCWKLDRLARNPVDGGSITWLLQQGIIEEIITPDKTYFPTDNVILMGIEFGMAHQYIIDLKRNVLRGMNSKLEKGWYPRLAPIGYLNEKHAEKGNKRILKDPVIFPVLQRLWKLLLSGDYTVGSLYHYMQKECPIFVNGKLMYLSTFRRIFKNPFYCGVFDWKGRQYLGSHTPMLTQKEFEKVQEMTSKPPEVRQTSVDYAFKGIFRCGVCDCMLTAEKHEKMIKKAATRKTFIYYKCCHKKRDVPCKEKTVSETKVVDQILSKIQDLEMPQEIIDLVLLEIERIKVEQEESLKAKQLRTEIANIDQRMKAVIDQISEEKDGEIRQYMKVKIENLKIQKRSYEEQVEAEGNQQSPVAALKDNLSVIKHAQKIFQNGDKEQKMKVMKVLGSNWKISSNIVDFKANFEVQSIQKAREFYLRGMSQVRTKEKGSLITETLIRATSNFLWSG